MNTTEAKTYLLSVLRSNKIDEKRLEELYKNPQYPEFMEESEIFAIAIAERLSRLENGLATGAIAQERVGPIYPQMDKRMDPIKEGQAIAKFLIEQFPFEDHCKVFDSLNQVLANYIQDRLMEANANASRAGRAEEYWRMLQTGQIPKTDVDGNPLVQERA
jgi:hypothetical protein